MKALAAVCLIICIWLLLPHSAPALEKRGKPGDKETLAKALKRGPYGQLGHGDRIPDLDAQAFSMRDYARFRQLQTEYSLAQKDVRLLDELGKWRWVISECRGGIYDLAYITAGGGDLYGHLRGTDCAEVEDFMAKLAPRLPLEGGKPDDKAAKQIDSTIAFLKKREPFVSVDAEKAKEARESMAEAIERVVAHWEDLKSLLQRVPAEVAGKIAAFAVEAVGKADLTGELWDAERNSNGVQNSEKK